MPPSPLPPNEEEIYVPEAFDDRDSRPHFTSVRAGSLSTVLLGRDQQDVLGTKAIPGADGWTGHRLVISKMRLRLQPRR
ncbi:unnamed protein product [Schistocephalus solidus]|uniref:Uncharacterized protein n=1 Tax=Schistocephalus solidus TaxID=70667 RepID=A0A183SMS3_SCHSO|nr:unnamed protein product [Schistocephalus solidus]